ncbi:hypothetical protein GCM10009087_30320 [Sphingomonas oligophenolica]
MPAADAMGYAGAMPDKDTDTESQVQTLDWSVIGDYRTVLREPSRPPSKGGNTAALHGHSIKIGDAWYSFLALGAQKWVFASDTVAFDWAWDASGKYRNIVKESIRTLDKNGVPVVRGNRGSKPKLRTAQTRLPARRSEWKD